MKFAVFSTLIAAAVAAVIPRQTGNGLNTFTLKAQSVAPDPLPSFGNLQWLNNRTTFTNPEPIGWFNATHTPLELFIQYNALEGTAFYSHDTALTVYLRPEDADGLSEVVLGNPELESNSAAMRSTNFTIHATEINPDEIHYLFGWENKYELAWSACPSTKANGWQLYFAPRGSKRGCTDPFPLEVSYTSGSS